MNIPKGIGQFIYKGSNTIVAIEAGTTISKKAIISVDNGLTWSEIENVFSNLPLDTGETVDYIYDDIQWDGTYYIMAIDTNQTYFKLLRSSDLINWTLITLPNLKVGYDIVAVRANEGKIAIFYHRAYIQTTINYGASWVDASFSNANIPNNVDRSFAKYIIGWSTLEGKYVLFGHDSSAFIGIWKITPGSSTITNPNLLAQYNPERVYSVAIDGTNYIYNLYNGASYKTYIINNTTLNQFPSASNTINDGFLTNIYPVKGDIDSTIIKGDFYKSGSPWTMTLEAPSGANLLCGINNGSIYLAGGKLLTSEAMLYRSIDNGATWNEVKPIVPTQSVSTIDPVDPGDITDTTAIITGEITDDGGSTITERGIAYNNNPVPTINNNKKVVSGTIGLIQANLDNLNPETTYYARIYTIHQDTSVSYGDEINFTTLEEQFNPDITRPQPPIITDLTENSVKLITRTGSKIMCNGEEKDSGSTWSGLTSGQQYTTYAYMHNGSNKTSSDSIEISFTAHNSDRIYPYSHFKNIVPDNGAAFGNGNFTKFIVVDDYHIYSSIDKDGTGFVHTIDPIIPKEANTTIIIKGIRSIYTNTAVYKYLLFGYTIDDTNTKLYYIWVSDDLITWRKYETPDGNLVPIHNVSFYFGSTGSILKIQYGNIGSIKVQEFNVISEIWGNLNTLQTPLENSIIKNVNKNSIGAVENNVAIMKFATVGFNPSYINLSSYGYASNPIGHGINDAGTKQIVTMNSQIAVSTYPNFTIDNMVSNVPSKDIYPVDTFIDYVFTPDALYNLLNITTSPSLSLVGNVNTINPDADNNILNHGISIKDGTIRYAVICGKWGVIYYWDNINNEWVIAGEMAYAPNMGNIIELSKDIREIEIQGIINDNGGKEITERGFVYSTNQNPTINDNKKIISGINTPYSGIIDNLEPNTTYYIKGYATNSIGTGYSDQLTITTDQLPQYPTPDLPIADNITYNSIRWTSNPGSIIVSNGEEKTSGSTWTGLSPNTQYDAYAYMPEDENGLQSNNSGLTSATTLKRDQVTPSAPIVSNLTTNSVTLTSIYGSVIVCNGEEKPSPANFDSLNPNTQYSSYAYIPETDIYYRSDDSSITNFTTLKEPYPVPSEPIASDIMETSVVLTSDEGTMIVCNGETKLSGSIWTGLTPYTQYDAYAYVPEDENYAQSDNSNTIQFTTDEPDHSIPSIPVASNITQTSITWTSDAGTKIVIVGIGEIDSPAVFEGLSPNTQYEAYAYMPASPGYDPSENSANQFATTLKELYPTPSIPIASQVTSESAKLDSDIDTIIVCNGEEKPTGSIWTGLIPNTQYDMYAYKPEDENYARSENSNTGTFTTGLPQHSKPIIPVATNISPRTVILTSDEGSTIVCNGEEKPSGSTFYILTPENEYIAYAYIAEDEDALRSEDSDTMTFTTLKDKLHSNEEVIIIMNDGNKAKPEVYERMNVTLSNDNCIYENGNIYPIKKGTCKITYEVDGKVNSLNITII